MIDGVSWQMSLGDSPASLGILSPGDDIENEVEDMLWLNCNSVIDLSHLSHLSHLSLKQALAGLRLYLRPQDNLAKSCKVYRCLPYCLEVLL